MSHYVHNPIQVYTDAACLIARDKLEILIYGLDKFVVSATICKIHVLAILGLGTLAELFFLYQFVTHF